MRDNERRETIRKERIDAGLCSQCGKPWIDPETIGKRKPKHCLNCQNYYKERYKAKSAVTTK